MADNCGEGVPEAHGVDASGTHGVQIGDGNRQFNLFDQRVQATSDPVAWPVLVGRPPRRAMPFQPRRDLVARVQEALRPSGSAVLSQVVAAGNGGVGKTQMAAAVFNEARDEEVDLLVWVNASTRDSVLTTYARACVAVGARTGESVDEAAESFLEWLIVTTRRWLIILDDVADPAELDQLWPDDTRGRVLITTRRRDVGRGIDIHVGVFTPIESVTYLTDKFTATFSARAIGDVLVEVDQLAEDLGHLPVALAQAGAVITTEAITCADYRRQFADKASELAELFPDQARADDYRHTVATAWTLAINQANKLQPLDLALPALEIAAVLDPSGIPDALWAVEPVLNHAYTRIGHKHAGAITAKAMRAALRNLHRLSLITHEPADGHQAVRTHALVQRAVINALTADQLDAAVRAAADALDKLWPRPANKPTLSQTLRNNVDSLSRHASSGLWQPDPHNVLFEAGNSLRESGQVAQAVTYHGRLVAECTAHLGPDHAGTLTARHNHAYMRGEAGDPLGAAEALEELFADRVRLLGADHRHTLNTRQNMLQWRGRAGDHAAAALAFEPLLTDLVRLQGPDHSDTLAARTNLAYMRD